MVYIDLCIDKDKSTTEKGRILENLVATLLKIQQYEVVETIRVTGMEIDVLAKSRINNSKIIVECKAWENPIPSDVISKLLGNVVLRHADEGWLVSTGPLSKDAMGIKTEWEEKNDSERRLLSFYTNERIVELLLNSGLVVNENRVKRLLETEKIAEEISLMLTEKAYYWIAPVLNQNGTINYVAAFYAKNGERVNDSNELNDLKHISNIYSDYVWSGDRIKTKTIIGKCVEEEFNSIVPVIGGDDWEDYRPARPEDFVGRKKILQNIFRYFDAVIEEKTETRLFSITAPSGMGKSSLVLKIAAMSGSRRKSKKYFVYALDSRTAMSSRYVELSIKSCFEKADKAGFTDVSEREIETLSIVQMLQSESIQKTLEYFKQENKIIIIIFDQFEELFSKKELSGVFEKIRQLSNLVDQMKSNLIIGFSWKTDLTIPAEHPAYFMWSNLTDRRKEFDLPQFQQAEIMGAIRVFGSQLGESINPVLRNYLSKQCQGYPWLLKKLCIHVFKLISEGSDQETVIGQKLNIIDLFERDINDLTAEEHACIKQIAQESPADYFKIADLFGNNIIQMLINKRIVIRRASRLTLYWDIFRDYVVDGKIPNILLDYIPQQQYATVARIVKCLLNENAISSEELSKKVNMKISTIENFLLDAVMFGIAKRQNGEISLIMQNEKDIVITLRAFFYRHLLYIELKNTYLQDFTYQDYMEAFLKVYEGSNITEVTKKTYASKLLNWFVNLGMVEVRSSTFYAIASVVQEELLIFKSVDRRTKYSDGEGHVHTVFWGETSPDKVESAYGLLQKKAMSYEELKKLGYRNAISVLWSFGGIRKENNMYYVSEELEEVYKNIENSETIVYAKKVLREDYGISEREMGRKLESEFRKQWKDGSRIRYGSAIRRWAKYFMSKDI